MMIRMMESTGYDIMNMFDAFSRTITFTVFLENRDECVKNSGKQ